MNWLKKLKTNILKYIRTIPFQRSDVHLPSRHRDHTPGDESDQVLEGTVHHLRQSEVNRGTFKKPTL